MNLIRTLILCLIFLTAGTATAQEHLEIKEAFSGQYRNKPFATETVVKGKELNRFGLTLYRSLTVTDPAAIAHLTALISADAEGALNKEESVKNGRLNYGFYEYPAQKPGPKRFSFFFSSKNKAVLIYMEGNTDIEHIKSLIKK